MCSIATQELDLLHLLVFFPPEWIELRRRYFELLKMNEHAVCTQQQDQQVAATTNNEQDLPCKCICGPGCLKMHLQSFSNSWGCCESWHVLGLWLQSTELFGFVFTFGYPLVVLCLMGTEVLKTGKEYSSQYFWANSLACVVDQAGLQHQQKVNVLCNCRPATLHAWVLGWCWSCNRGLLDRSTTIEKMAYHSYKLTIAGRG